MVKPFLSSGGCCLSRAHRRASAAPGERALGLCPARGALSVLDTLRRCCLFLDSTGTCNPGLRRAGGCQRHCALGVTRVPDSKRCAVCSANPVSLSLRPPCYRCKELKYGKDLPQISIIFIFVNEALSVILRSVHSAVNHTPAHLLKEIILVDDNSDEG